jgi:hypothetical protein
VTGLLDGGEHAAFAQVLVVVKVLGRVEDPDG